MRKWMSGTVAAAAFAALAAFPAAAEGFSPATGEHTSALPWVLGGVGLVAVIALVAVTLLAAKRKKNAPPPGGPMPPMAGNAPGAPAAPPAPPVSPSSENGGDPAQTSDEEKSE